MPTWSRPGTDVTPELRRRFVRRIRVGGLNVKVELLPAVWLAAPFTGIMASAGPGHSVSFTIDRPYARARKADYDRLIRRIRVAPCSRPGCRGRYLVGGPTTSDRLCRRHGQAELPVKAAREEADIAARIARDDARAKARGMRYRAFVWIHRDGDDYALVRYFRARPAKDALRRIARAKRSMIIEDFQVERL
jgi:hypothetical protein